MARMICHTFLFKKKTVLVYRWDAFLFVVPTSQSFCLRNEISMLIVSPKITHSLVSFMIFRGWGVKSGGSIIC